MAKKKEESKGAKARRVIQESIKFVKIRREQEAAEKAAAAKKKAANKPAPKKSSWVSRLKKKVRTYFSSESKKKPVKTTARTRSIQKQLGKAGVTMKTDQERAAEKKAKGNTHGSHNSSKSKGGY